MVAPNADTAANQVPRANVRSPGDAFDPQIWVTVPNVPVFAEHETTARDGRRLRFTKNELEAIAHRCNQRIRETGDYAAITLGHTPEDETGPQPEMIGLAGPFRIGLLGEPGQRQRYAILCDYHIYRDKAELLRQYPRRSPELYLEDRYDQMYLDPIALLGAQAPRLDMGLLYSAVRGGRLVEKYAAACPAAGSVFIPSTGDKTYYAADTEHGRTPPTPNQETPPMALTPDDVRQIVDAFDQLDWVQFVKQQMASQTPPPAAEPPVDQKTPAAPPPAAEPPVPDKASAPPAAEPPKPLQKEPEKEKLGAVAQHYSADGSAEGDAPEKPGTASVAGASDDALQGTAKGTVAGEPEKDGSAKNTIKMARVLADQQALKGEIGKLRQQLDCERYARRFAERYSVLAGLREHLTFDLDAEAELAKDFSEDQFEKYAASLRRNCQRIPLFHDLPTHEDEAVSDARDRPAAKEEREKFTKAHRETALRYCKEKAMAGQEVHYEAVLEMVVQGKPLPQ